MPDIAALNEALEDSLENSTSVGVTVLACRYKCCGAGWQQRYHVPVETYVGRVLSIDVESFLLQCGNELGKMAELIANFNDLVSVTPIP